MKLHGNTKDLTGQRFGKLTAICRSNRLSNRGRRDYFLCRCDCGNESTVRASHLRQGNTSACRNCANLLPPGEAGFRQVHTQYRFSALRRGYGWALSEEQFRALITANCHYCGKEPSQVKRTRRRNGECIESSKYICGGIDRVDSTQGYNWCNVRPCCEHCNRAKMALSESEFYDLIKRIAAERPWDKIDSGVCA